MSKKRQEYIELWYSALAAPLGIVVWTDNPQRLSAYLYTARSKAMDPTLQCLSLIRSPTNPEHLWIIKRHAPQVDS